LAPVVVIGGGVRSGKSRFAVQLAQAHGPERVFVATAQAFDDEMRERIALHREERAGTFETLEAPVDLAVAAAVMKPVDVVLLDCLTLYVSNSLLRVADVETLDRGAVRRVEEDILSDLRAGILELRRRTRRLVVVTNEVGMGVVPVSRLGRLFRDIAGRVNQSIAADADEVWWCAFGVPLCIKPAARGSAAPVWSGGFE
jgi:adenosylcobinamide kinase / adenosylcobinamide-phosphate guanylyltransferase